MLIISLPILNRSQICFSAKLNQPLSSCFISLMSITDWQRHEKRHNYIYLSLKKKNLMHGHWGFWSQQIRWWCLTSVIRDFRVIVCGFSSVKGFFFSKSCTLKPRSFLIKFVLYCCNNSSMVTENVCKVTGCFQGHIVVCFQVGLMSAAVHPSTVWSDCNQGRRLLKRLSKEKKNGRISYYRHKWKAGFVGKPVSAAQ